MSENVEVLLRSVQRGRERHSPPVVNKALFRWPTPSPCPPGLVVEELEYYVEDGPQGWVPLRIVRPLDEPAAAPPPPASAQPSESASPAEAPPPPAQPAAAEPLSNPPPPPAREGEVGASEAVEELQGRGEQPRPRPPRRPLLVFIHATGESMDVMRPKQELYARMGYCTAAIDARYHGQRAAVPHDVAAALNAAAPKVAAPAETSPAAPAAGESAATALVATVKGLSPKALAALERADAAAGLAPPPPSAESVEPHPPLSYAPTMGRTMYRTSAPAGSRTAAAEAREEAEARDRAMRHERFVQAWLGIMAEFRQRRGAEAATAALATAPPPPPPLSPSLPPLQQQHRQTSTTSDSGASAASGAADTTTAFSSPAGVAAAAAATAASAAGRWSLTHGHRGAAVARSDRVTARNVYELALAAAWRGSGEMPLFLDTVWDLVLLLDVLAVRQDIDTTRVGVTGYSMGGSIAWLWSVIDPRVTVSAPVAGVQGFGWAIDNESYHARVSAYPLVFEVAAGDLKGEKSAEVDAEVVTAVWDKLLPGLLSYYDARLSLPTLAPRPLLVVTGEVDPRCPLPGVHQALDVTRESYMTWALEQRELQLEAAAAAIVATESGALAATPAPSLVTTLAGEASQARVGGAAQASGGSTAAAACSWEVASDAGSVLAAAREDATAAALASLAATAEEDAVVAAAEAAAEAAAAAAAATAAARAALAAAADAERREREAISGLLGSRFRFLVEKGVGHTETEAMRRAVEQWMNRHLLEPWRREQIAAQAAAAAAAEDAASAAAVGVATAQ